MKIRELLEGPVNTSFKTRQLSREMQGYRNRRGHGNVQSGTFSSVTADPDPHMIQKSSNKALSPNFKEGFRLFIEFINENGYADNPHMPKVYKVNKIVGKDGYYLDTYKTEKLLTYKDISLEEIKNLIYSILPESEIPEWVSESDDKTDLLGYLAGEIGREVVRPTKRFKLESLNEACAIVAEALAKFGADSDLHYGNILYRRTRYGLQPVLNDPIFIPD